MAKVGAQRAAELTGKSKSTIQRAMKSGKISFELDRNNRRIIDVAELERAFGLISQKTQTHESVENDLKKAADMLELERLKMRVKFLEEQLSFTQSQLDDLKDQRDQWQKQAQQVLLTSQYSQKQAEDYKEQLKERQRRARQRRQEALKKRSQTAVNKNTSPKTGKKPETGNGKGIDIQGLWHKIRGQNEKILEKGNDKKQAVNA